ncbi:MAG TPA: glycosyltransferase family 2 protein [Alloacidobacterium sp.]|jgi:glycosyltransferase involved in cell wall biosynthesis|nr:glycosyltransferase family 2 protein [Alloacidobacterium sp.]
MISVVVPIYNEEELISQFHIAVAEAMKSTGEHWEVVYVNDGSRDSSLELLKGLQTVDSHVVVVDLSRNWGHMGAISAGLQTARGDAVVLMDGDFQDPPEVVPELVEAWKGGAQVVVAVRRSRKERRKILAKLFPLFYRVLSALSDYPIPLNAGIFGLMDRQAVDSINAMRENNRYLPGLRAWVGYSNTVVFYDRQDRLAGDGKLSFISRIKYAMDAITSFSYKPLRLCFVLAFFCSLLAAILAISTIFSNTAVGSMGLGLSATVFLVGCFVLLCMGVLGEYLGRVYDEVRNRPLSIINKVYYASEMLAEQETNYEETDSGKIFRVA